MRSTIRRLTRIPGVPSSGHRPVAQGTISFTVDSPTPDYVAGRLGEQGVNVWSGHAYHWELTRVLRIRDTGGAIRVTLAPDTAESDLDRLVAAMAAILTCSRPRVAKGGRM